MLNHLLRSSHFKYLLHVNDLYRRILPDRSRNDKLESTTNPSTSNQFGAKDVSNAIPNSDLTLEDLPPKILGDRSLVCKTVVPDNTIDVGNIISGTYVHSLLIPHIACWISVDFAPKVSEVINGYIVYEYKRKAEDLEVQLKREINC